MRLVKIVLIAAVVTLFGAGAALAGNGQGQQAGNHGRTPNPAGTCTPSPSCTGTCTPSPSCTGTPAPKHERKRDRKRDHKNTGAGKQHGKKNPSAAPQQNQ